MASLQYRTDAVLRRGVGRVASVQYRTETQVELRSPFCTARALFLEVRWEYRVASAQYSTDFANRVAESLLYESNAALRRGARVASVQYRTDSASRVAESVLYNTDAVLRGAVGI